MDIGDLKKKTIAELTEVAQELKLEDISSMKNRILSLKSWKLRLSETA
jgi:hypothetical protein